MKITVKGTVKLYRMCFYTFKWEEYETLPIFEEKPRVYADGEDITDKMEWGQRNKTYLFLTADTIPDNCNFFSIGVALEAFDDVYGECEFEYDIDVDKEKFDPTSLWIPQSDEKEYPDFGVLYKANKIYYNWSEYEPDEEIDFLPLINKEEDDDNDTVYEDIYDYMSDYGYSRSESLNRY